METQVMVEKPLLQKVEKMCKESVYCPGGKVFKTSMVCGCCFCENVSCICEWHQELGGYWS